MENECLVIGCGQERMKFRSSTGKESRRKYCGEHWVDSLAGKLEGVLVKVQMDLRVGADGYVRIWNGERRVMEHRQVMEAKLGRELVRGESVHHINGDRGDNRVENLELWINPQPTGVRARDLRCPHCGKSYHGETSGLKRG